ncbi:MAG: HIT family protein [Solirubrobacterales bacterium]|nr:HIT family protein [Solirubrobacterales bacterium]
MPETDCIFCKIIAGELPAHKLYEDERTFAFLDVNPGSRGHLLVVPKTHAADILTVEPADLAAVATTAQAMAKHVKARLGADGVNIINSCGAAAWQTVFHLHFHVIPRYPDDGLVLPWKPAPADQGDLAKLADELR